MLAKERRDAAVAQKRKREEEEKLARVDQIKKARRDGQKEFTERWADATVKALQRVEEQLVDVTRNGYDDKEIRRELELLGARWTAQAKSDADEYARNRERKEREARCVSMTN